MYSPATSFIAGLVDSPQGLQDFIRISPTKELFRGPDEETCYQILTSFLNKYGVLPSRQRFQEQGIDLPSNPPDPIDFYAEQLRTRHLHMTLKQSVLDVQEYLNAENPEKALSYLGDTLLRLTRAKHGPKMLNFAADGKELIAHAIKLVKLQGDSYGIKTGWPTLDNMVGGVTGGDVVAIVGRPANGKTYCMLYNAEHAWNVQDKIPMFVTMEMKTLLIAQRLAAVNAKKPITALKKGELSSAAEKDLFAKLEHNKTKESFWIIDGGLTATVKEIILLARQLKPSVVYIDGAYLVKGDDPRQQRWDRTTSVLERVKGDLAEALDIPVFISFQFNREGTKKGGLEHIAYADAVGQLSSVVLGMGMSDKVDSVETLNTRKIDILKGRSGECGSFNINWRFDQGPNYMDFSEVKEIQQTDLTYGME